MKFLSAEATLYLYKSTVGPWMETVVTSELVLLVGTCICWTTYKNRYAGLLVLHLLPLLNPWLIAEMQPAKIFSIGINVVDVHLNWLNWFQFLIFERSSCYSDRLQDFSVNISKCYKDVYINSFFPWTARLWNFLPEECFLLTYDLNGFV